VDVLRAPRHRASASAERSTRRRARPAAQGPADRSACRQALTAASAGREELAEAEPCALRSRRGAARLFDSAVVAHLSQCPRAVSSPPGPRVRPCSTVKSPAPIRAMLRQNSRLWSANRHEAAKRTHQGAGAQGEGSEKSESEEEGEEGEERARNGRGTGEERARNGDEATKTSRGGRRRGRGRRRRDRPTPKTAGF